MRRHGKEETVQMSGDVQGRRFVVIIMKTSEVMVAKEGVRNGTRRTRLKRWVLIVILERKVSEAPSPKELGLKHGCLYNRLVLF